MNEAVAPSRTPVEAVFHNLKLFLPAVVVFVAIIAFNVWQLYSAGIPQLQENGVPISPEIEERFGVRITGLYLSAQGGLVDLRYRVVDVGKAKNFGHDTENSPLLIAEASGKVVDVTIMMKHSHRIELGRIYYILFRNTGNAVEPGSTVTVQIGNLRLEHVVAR